MKLIIYKIFLKYKKIAYDSVWHYDWVYFYRIWFHTYITDLFWNEVII